jgi:hypothetical protein
MNRGQIMCRLSVISILISIIFASAGCGPKKPLAPKGSPTPPKAGNAAVLLLKFSKGQSDTYKSIMENERNVAFTGEITQDTQFKNAKTGTRAEIVFQQQIENVDSSGNASVKVTIKSLKYLSRNKDVITLDYDSSNPGQQSDPMTRLIGQSYMITMSPGGEMTRIEDLIQIKQAAGSNPAAVQLVSENIIRERHQIPAIIDSNSRLLKVGDKWSVNRTLEFGILGSTSVEKIYTLKAIERNKGRRTAVVEITTVPATVQDSQPTPKKFESNNSYTGSLVFDLDSSKVEQCNEKMTSDWLTVDEKSTQGEPSTIKLGTMKLNSLERLE